MTMLKKILPLALLSFGLVACGSRSSTDDDDTSMPPPNTDLVCPANANLTVCDMKLTGGQRQPAIGDPVSLMGVVVTTPTLAVGFNMMGEATLAAFFVQDRTTSDDLADRFSGIAVAYSIGSVSVPPVGAVIDIEGTYDEFSRNGSAPEKQVKATFVSPPSGNEAVRVKSLTVDQLTADYEGSVVELSDTVATSVNPAGAGGMMIFGFQLNNKVIVSTAMTRYFARVGEEFLKVTGVYRLGTFNYDAGIYTLTPRIADDIQPKNPIQRVTSITAVQDPQSPDRPADMCSSDQPTADRRCPKLSLTDVVVTAVGGYVSANLRAMWVQDPSVVGGRFSGIKVTYSSDTTNLPSVGDLINVEGEVIEWYGGTQVQFPTFSPGSGTMTPVPVVVDPSAIGRDSDATTNPYEGVLVTLQNVQVTERCIEDTMYRDHGDWVVAGNVLVSTAFMYDYNGMLRAGSTTCDNQPNGNCSCMAMSRPNDMRAVNDDFASITGVIDYSFDELRLDPRGNADLMLQ